MINPNDAFSADNFNFSLLECQQYTLNIITIIRDIENPIFLNYESLLLYREKYVKSLNINIPIDYNSISENIQVDQNQKYICNFKPSPLRKR